MMEMNSFLRRILADHYALKDIELRATSGGSEADRSVVMIRGGEKKYIFRVYPPENTRSNPTALAQVLSLLAEVDFPAERIISATNGDALAEVDGWRTVLTTFIEGTPTDQLDSEFYGLGAILGRLHALFTPEELLARHVPTAERSLDAEMAMARRDLLAVPRPDQPELGAFYDELLAAIDAIDRCHDLPYTLIHNDFQPGNVLLKADGLLSVIDWDGSGRSPGIVDLGYLIGHLHPEGSLRPEAARIHALLDGYLQHKTLSQTEIERLSDMIRFRPITYLTSDFGNYIAHMDDPDPSYMHCLAIYHTVDEAAAIAREYILSAKPPR
ncbi:MAG: phosphotransferase [Chloroflexota bacterium]